MLETEPALGAARPQVRRDLAALLFLTLLGTYAYFWQSRDWNASSRLMLTYSLVDRHQVAIDGLEGQAGFGEIKPLTGRFEMVGGDLARYNEHYFTDKAPGQSMLGAVVYQAARLVGAPAHPLDEERAKAYWPPDYVATVGTSGVLTALLSVVVYAFGLRLGMTQPSAVLLGLAYGLATPAMVYATLFYGHQTSAFCTFTSFFLVYRAAHEGRTGFWNMFAAGCLAGFAIVVEYQTAIISGVLGLYALLAIRRFGPVATFALGAVMSASLLAAYNYAAFGDPLDMGYAHEVAREFKDVHSAQNPLGIRWPSPDKAREALIGILWGPFRGLLFYAPVLLAAPLGLFALLWHKRWGVAAVSAAAIGWMILLNVSYPLWPGGWCTGPRLLVPALPFAVLLVAGLLGAVRHVWLMAPIGAAIAAGSILMLCCVAVGGRFPPGSMNFDRRGAPAPLENPVRDIAWPHWRGRVDDRFAPPLDGSHPNPDRLCPMCGQHPASYLAGGRQFERNAGRWLMQRLPLPDALRVDPSPWQALQFAPLAVFLTAMLSVLLWRARL
jgi:hypothetical protein